MKSQEKKSVSALPEEGQKTSFALGKTNLILIAISFVVIVIGFLLMLGNGTTPEAYNPDIFSARRIKVAPVVCLVGFVGMVYAIIRKPKSVAGEALESVEPTQEATAE